jgi:hypothetical protein
MKSRLLFASFVLICVHSWFNQRFPRLSPGEIKIRTAHEIMAARTAQLALFIDQLVPAAQAVTPVFAGVVSRRSWAGVQFGFVV